MPGRDALLVYDDERDFYGKHYFEQMTQRHGLPTLEVRTRTDLQERCVHWLRGLLQYRLPPARILELGSSHGAFVALMRWAGFDATGLELSPWLAGYARRTFDIPVLVCPVESQDLPPQSLDAVVLMDVLEHLADPMGTLGRCLELLAPAGLLFLQTPRYREGKTLEQMQAEDDPFLQMLKPDQHLYLYSRSSVQLLLRKLGVEYINFEPAIFSSYDMALAAGRRPLTRFSEEEAAARLASRAASRVPLALLDLHRRYTEAEADRAARLQQLAALPESVRLLDRVRQSRVFHVLRRLGLWRWLDPQAAPRAHAAEAAPRSSRGLKRVAVDLTPVLPGGENGGAKVMTLELIRHLGRMAPDCEFILLTSARSHDELASLDSENVRRLCVSQPGGMLRASDNLALRARRFLARFLPPSGLETLAGFYREVSEKAPAGASLMRRLDADLLFCPFTAPFFFDPSVPMVSVVYDLQHIYYAQFFESAEIRERDRNFSRAFRLASRIVCISEFVRKTVLENAALPAQRVETIPILLPRRLPNVSPAVRQRVLESLQLQPERYLLYPANFWPHKNHVLLLTALGIYRAAYPQSDLKLVLTGAPSRRRDELMEASRRMALSQAVVFPGYLPDEQMSALMGCCGALIFPSLFEGFGMPLLEAMAAGRPILSSNATSLPEVAGDAALFFDPRKPSEIADAIARIEADPELRSVLARKSSERLSAFGGPEEMAARYMNVFHDALRQPAELSPALYGAFADGWLGERVHIAFGRGNGQRILIVKLAVPPWSPIHDVSVQLLADGAAPAAYTVSRGQPTTINRALGANPGLIELLCSPAFQPNTCGRGDDPRSLTCQLQSAEIVGADGVAVPLKSEPHAA